MIIQRHELEDAHLTAAFWGNLGVGGLCATALVLLAWPLSTAQGKPELLLVMVALAPVLLLSSASWIYHAQLRRLLRYDVAALSGLVSVIGGGIAGVGLAWGGFGVWSLVGQQLVGACVALALLIASSSWQPSPRLSKRHLRDLTGFAGKVVAGNVLDFLSRRMDAAILGFFLSAHVVGLYFVASRLTFTLGMLTYFVVNDLCLAVLSRLQASRDAMRERASTTLQMAALFCLPTFIGLALVAEPAVLLLFGPGWRESVVPLQIMCAFSIAYALNLIGREILNAAGHPQLGLRLAAAGAVLALVATTIAAPLGLAAAALGSGIAYALSVPFTVLLLRRVLGIDIRRLLGEQLPIWAATGVMALVVAGSSRLGWLSFAADNPLALVPIKATIGATAFLIALRLIAPALFFRAIRFHHSRGDDLPG